MLIISIFFDKYRISTIAAINKLMFIVEISTTNNNQLRINLIINKTESPLTKTTTYYY